MRLRSPCTNFGGVPKNFRYDHPFRQCHAQNKSGITWNQSHKQLHYQRMALTCSGDVFQDSLYKGPNLIT